MLEVQVCGFSMWQFRRVLASDHGLRERGSLRSPDIPEQLRVGTLKIHAAKKLCTVQSCMLDWSTWHKQVNRQMPFLTDHAICERDGVTVAQSSRHRQT